ncbi:MAG: hypothetical protein K5856_08535 [Bacteroidaceae bacterium]|nr:hypothetical protein [Bacteroidaceae bacterium]
MNSENDISHLRAEVLLNRLYPEYEQQWRVHNLGSFYRNYTEDILFLDEETKELELSRDGFVNLLPEGLFNRQDDLKGEDMHAKFKEQELRIRLLKDAFVPIDSYWFKQSLYVERQISELLEKKLDYILLTYFGFDLNKEQDPLVKKVAVILPFISVKRGDFGFVRNLLETLFHCEVVMEEGRYSHTDNTVRWLPMVRYNLLIPGLTAEEYKQRNEAMEPLRKFIKEWFMPVEVECQMLLKEYGVPQQTDMRLVLDYNTETTK